MDVQKEFEFVKKVFFPRWDRNKNWKIEISKMKGFLQHKIRMDVSKNRISVYVPEEFKDVAELHVYFIHYISSIIAKKNETVYKKKMKEAFENAKKLESPYNEIAEKLSIRIR